eukprot:TRINITY_DN49443_c0_g1_i1.p1 TRINITY_DN49443_c0_g1~~TRINITY_DN49443_c0_g1_i1.p1  ORF type:complete len:1066 (+),score=259.91 TRINITY_DN49443_c0_g1_i1:131-3328(+)
MARPALPPEPTINENAVLDCEDAPTGYRVLVRVRPLLRFADSPNEPVAVKVTDSQRLRVTSKAGNEADIMELKVDRAFGPESSQVDVFKSVRDVVQSALQGQCGTVLAYGQTGSGKTYTMTGEAAAVANDGGDEELRLRLQDTHRGLIPRAMELLFRRNAEATSTVWSVKLSFMEIYNERVYDLLKPAESRAAPPKPTGSWRGSVPQKDPMLAAKAGSATLDVLETRDGSVSVPGLTMVEVRNLQQALEVLRIGTTNRTMGDNGVNPTSSRSHAIFQVLLEQRRRKTGTPSVSKLSLVDLAGSEKIRNNAVVSKTIMDELTAINTSLSALGQCISALVSTKRTHVPCRDSKLTRLLQDSFRGRALTVMCVCVSPTASSLEETLSSLKFADRAKRAVLDRRPPPSQAAAAVAAVSEQQVEELRVRMEELTHELHSEKEARLRLEEKLQSHAEAVKLRMLADDSESSKSDSPRKLRPPQGGPLRRTGRGGCRTRGDAGDRGGSPSFGDDQSSQCSDLDSYGDLDNRSLAASFTGSSVISASSSRPFGEDGHLGLGSIDDGSTGTSTNGSHVLDIVSRLHELTQQNNSLKTRLDVLEGTVASTVATTTPAEASKAHRGKERQLDDATSLPRGANPGLDVLKGAAEETSEPMKPLPIETRSLAEERKARALSAEARAAAESRLPLENSTQLLPSQSTLLAADEHLSAESPSPSLPITPRKYGKRADGWRNMGQRARELPAAAVSALQGSLWSSTDSLSPDYCTGGGSLSSAQPGPQSPLESSPLWTPSPTLERARAALGSGSDLRLPPSTAETLSANVPGLGGFQASPDAPGFSGEGLGHDSFGSGLGLHSASSGGAVGSEAAVEMGCSSPSSPLRRLAASHRSRLAAQGGPRTAAHSALAAEDAPETELLPREEPTALAMSFDRRPAAGSSSKGASGAATSRGFAAALAAANADLDAAEASSTAWLRQRLAGRDGADKGVAKFGRGDGVPAAAGADGVSGLNAGTQASRASPGLERDPSYYYIGSDVDSASGALPLDDFGGRAAPPGRPGGRLSGSGAKSPGFAAPRR